MTDQLVVPAHATVTLPGRAFLVKGWLGPQACTVLGPQIVTETFDRWQGQLKYGSGKKYFDRGHSMCRFGDPGVTYTYKDKKKPMYEFTPGLNTVRTHLVKSLAWIPNCVVVNSYAPSSGLYPHRDGKYIPQLGNNPIIASVSFGATRTFSLFPADPITNKRIKGAAQVDVVLGDGDLFVMHGDCDTRYHHGLPEEPNANGTRVSLTFRRHIM